MVEFAADTIDGIRLKGWYTPAREKPYTIVFFHGSGDGLATVAGLAQPYVRAGYGMLLAEYRGYSGEPGVPSETGLYDDGRAYLRALQANGIAPKQIVLFGHSLGTGVATLLATEYPVGGLMLLSPFLSVDAVAARLHPLLPVRLLISDSFVNFRHIAATRCPILIGHGGMDSLIPVDQAKALFTLANEPKTLKIFPAAGHLNAFDDFSDAAINWLDALSVEYGKR
ncbi:hypothetical protein UP10_41820 [Bradyrhizobium sp. LTSPM299]|nr:hypothetical protein UP10_41820 [Bradyrhizobium sp. LTSPM299]